MDYLVLKALHVASAAASLSLFVTRGVWMISAPERLQRRWVKIVPHIVDTVLLASALALVWQLGGLAALRAQSWLVAKIVALLAYIALGSIALKRGRTMRTRIVAFIVAVAVFGYIVSVAIAKSPFGFLSGLEPTQFRAALVGAGATRRTVSVAPGICTRFCSSATADSGV